MTTQNELERLRKTNEFKDKLFAIIGHDLKSPLNSIKGIALLLQYEDISVTERKELTELLLNSVENSMQMLDNLLDWGAQNYYGDVLDAKTKAEPLNLCELAGKSIRFIQHHAAKKNIQIINNVTQGITIHADKQQVLFVLRNLISNAIKFSYEDRQVIVEAKGVSNTVEVSVKDYGIGMSRIRMESLFLIEKRIAQEGTHNEKGAGLALILCKEFVENNGGKIWVESDGSNGSTFKFTVKSMQ